MANKYDQMIQILSFNQQNEKVSIFIKAGARKQNSISDKIKRSSWKINQEKMNVDFVVRNIRNFNSYNKNNEKGYNDENQQKLTTNICWTCIILETTSLIIKDVKHEIKKPYDLKRPRFYLMD